MNSRKIAQAGTDEWYRARRRGVSATAVAKASTPSGFREQLNYLLNPTEIPDNAYMKFGRDYEQWIVDNIPDSYGIHANDWLVCADGPGNEWQLATPDGLSDDWSIIAEVKTTGKEWGSYHQIPIQYRRQVQWQLHVTGAELCVFAYLLRAESPDGRFVPAWYAPEIYEIQRDETMIAELIDTAQKLQQEVIYREESENGTV
jgi:hypothetical protein